MSGYDAFERRSQRRAGQEVEQAAHAGRHKRRRRYRSGKQSARQRYASLLEQHPQWADRIALKHLASYLGVTDVSLSRLRSEMGLIKG